MNIVERNIRRVIELCKQYKVNSLYLFGSILTPRFRKDSDIDFLVRFDKHSIQLNYYEDNFFDFKYAFEDLLGRKIDLVCYDAIKNPYFLAEVDSKKQLIYG